MTEASDDRQSVPIEQRPYDRDVELAWLEKGASPRVARARAVAAVIRATMPPEDFPVAVPIDEETYREDMAAGHTEEIARAHARSIGVQQLREAGIDGPTAEREWAEGRREGPARDIRSSDIVTAQWGPAADRVAGARSRAMPAAAGYGVLSFVLLMVLGSFPDALDGLPGSVIFVGAIAAAVQVYVWVGVWRTIRHIPASGATYVPRQARLGGPGPVVALAPGTMPIRGPLSLITRLFGMKSAQLVAIKDADGDIRWYRMRGFGVAIGEQKRMLRSGMLGIAEGDDGAVLWVPIRARTPMHPLRPLTSGDEDVRAAVESAGPRC